MYTEITEFEVLLSVALQHNSGLSFSLLRFLEHTHTHTHTPDSAPLYE